MKSFESETMSSSFYDLWKPSARCISFSAILALRRCLRRLFSSVSARSFSRARLALFRNDTCYTNKKYLVGSFTSISAYVTSPMESLTFDVVVMTCFLLTVLWYCPVLIASEMSAKVWAGCWYRFGLAKAAVLLIFWPAAAYDLWRWLDDVWQSTLALYTWVGSSVHLVVWPAMLASRMSGRAALIAA